MPRDSTAPVFSQDRGATARSVAANAPGLGPGDRRCNSCRADQFPMLPWPNTSGIHLLSGPMRVELPPAAPLPDGVKVARRPVKPLVLVRVQVWQPISRVKSPKPTVSLRACLRSRLSRAGLGLEFRVYAARWSHAARTA